MTPHPYADILRAVADGEEIQVNPPGGHWVSINSRCAISDIADGRYPPNCFRIKQKTIRIGEFDVPEPVRQPLRRGCEYWAAAPQSLGPCLSERHFWDGGVLDHQWLRAGLIHISREAADTHAKALLSFTSEK